MYVLRYGMADIAPITLLSNSMPKLNGENPLIKKHSKLRNIEILEREESFKEINKNFQSICILIVYHFNVNIFHVITKS